MNNNTFVHKYISSLISQDDIAVDMTAGNGNDTVFLAERAGYVYAFDISKQAIGNTYERIKHMNNVKLIHDNHINIDRYDIHDVRLFIFNLGYLPHSDDPNISKADETLIAFKKAYALLEDDGYIVITFYTGHKGGKNEYYLLDDYLKDNGIRIMERYRQDRIDSPVTYIIRKDQSRTPA